MNFQGEFDPLHGINNSYSGERAVIIKNQNGNNAVS